MEPDDIRRSIREAYDERAEAYDENAMHRALAAEVAAFVRLDGVMSTLDVATGTGLVLRALADRSPDLRLTGIDLSSGMLAVARRSLPGAEWIQADAVALPIRDGSVDLVTCVTALHIIPEVDAAVAEWVRVLVPGGRAVTATFAGEGHPHSHTHTGDHAPRYPRVHAPFATADALAATVAPSGLELTRHEVWSHGDDTVLIAELRKP